jgi:hypothetical protein
VSPTEAAEHKVTIADEFRDTIYVGSVATGSLLPSRQHCRICRSFETDPTSDPVRNQVDSYWLSLDPVEVYVVIPIIRHIAPMKTLAGLGSVESSIVLSFDTPQLPMSPVGLIAGHSFSGELVETTAPPDPLPDLLVRLRRQLDMPVGDLARMLGLGRRHFYNLSAGGNASRETESRVRTVSAMVTQLHDELDDAELVRAAILTPVGRSTLTFYEVAERGGIDELRAMLDALIRRIHGRGIRRVRRAVPRRATAQQREERNRRAGEALGDLPPRDSASRGDPGGAD